MSASVLKEYYHSEVLPKLMASQGYTNRLQAPRLTKVVVNAGIGSGREREAVPEAVKILATITGQKPVVTKDRTSISNFKLREGMQVGVCVTLRGETMFNFLQRLIHLTLPRVRDFRGVSPKAFDGAGNYTMGLSEPSVFSEVDMDKVKHACGMNITIVTTAKTDAEAKELLKLLGMPFSN